jgi:hypothetical protein
LPNPCEDKFGQESGSFPVINPDPVLNLVTHPVLVITPDPVSKLDQATKPDPRTNPVTNPDTVRKQS